VCTSHGLSAILGFERPADAWPAAETYIRRALGIDSTIAEAHQYLSSQAFFFRWNWVDADRELREAQRLKGKEQNPDFLRELALQRWALGRLDEAIAAARRAREVDPVSPEFTLWLADYLLHAQRLDEAAALYEKVIRDDPTDARAYFGLAELRRVQGRFDDALDARRRAHGAIGDDSLVEAFRNAHGEAAYRRMEEAAVRQELESLKSRAIDAYVSPLDFGRAYAQLGETEQAFSYFEPAFAERASGLVFLNVDRAWDRIRDDPRFPPFVHRVGLS
jgi:tetratricopeptide (TPR) repeat protein